MELSKIEELARIARENGLTVLEVEEEGGVVRIGRQQSAPAQAEREPHGSEKVAAAPASASQNAQEDAVDFNRVHEIRSPMVGVFYAAPSPQEEPFVSIGARVKKGDVLCVIEAMKLMNEIVADQDGEVVDVCVSNGQAVEYGQTLFKLF